MMTERESYWRQAIERQARSGDSIAAFCEAEGVSTASFYTWRKRLRDVLSRQPALLPVTIAPTLTGWNPAARSCVEIVLAGGILLRVPDGITPQTLHDVLAALEPDRC